MASAFNLTAQINLRGPSNVRQVVAGIRRQLGSISANINLQIDPRSARNVTALNRALTDFNRTLGTTTTNATNAAAAIQRLQSAVTGLSSTRAASPVIQLNAAIGNAQTLIPNLNRSINSASDSIRTFGRQSGVAVKKFAAFGASTAVIYGVSNAVSKSLKEFIEFDRQLVRLQQITGKNLEGLRGLSDTITNLSTGLGVASSSLIGIADTLAQAGLSAKETEQALRALALSDLAPSFSSLNDTVEGSIALMRQFAISTNDLEKALGSINAVAASFAVEAGDIIKAVQRTGGVFASASKGVSEGTDALNEFIAIFTSVRATTRESAETIATGLRTIFTRIQRGSTIEALKEFGITLTDAEGKFVGAYKAIELLSNGLNRIDPRDIKFSDIVEELGGFRQIGKVIPLIQQFATAQDALRVAQEGQGSLATDAAKGQLALAVQIQKVREEFNALIRSVGQSESFQQFVKVGLDLASALIKVADAAKGLLPLVAIFAAFKGLRAASSFAGGFAEGLTGNRRQRYAAQGGIMKFAKGGPVPGFSSGDTVPAMLEPGEFVVRKKAARAIGSKNLNRINKYDTGGIANLAKEGNKSTLLNSVIQDKSQLDKDPGQKFEVYSKTPNRFNPKDIVKANIIEKKIKVDDYVNSTDDTVKNAVKDYFGVGSLYADESDSKKKKTLQSTARGNTFERVLGAAGIVNLATSIKTGKRISRSRIDGVDKDDVPSEIKSYTTNITRAAILKKAISSAIQGPKDGQPGQILGSKLTDTKLTSQQNTIDLGTVHLYSDNSSTDPVSGEAGKLKGLEPEKKTKRNTGAKAKKTTRWNGGIIQKFMAGSLVEPDQSVENIIERIRRLGGTGAVVDKLGGAGLQKQMNRQLFSVNKIRSGKSDLKKLSQLLDKAEGKETEEIKAQEEAFNKRREGALKVQLASITPFNSSFNEVYDDIEGVKVNLVGGGIKKEYIPAVEEMQKESRGLSRRFADRLRGDKPTSFENVEKSPLDEKMGQGNIEGAVLEKALAELGAPIVADDIKQNRPIDYPAGLGASAKYFVGLNSTTPTEVKRHRDKWSLEAARNEIARAIRENVLKFDQGGELDPDAPSLKQLEFIKSLVGKFYSNEAQIKQFMSTVYDKQTASKQIQQLQNAQKWTGLFKTLLTEGKSVGFLGGIPFAYYSRIDTASSSFDDLKDEETIRAFLERGKLAFGSLLKNTGSFGERRYNRSKGYRRSIGGLIQKFVRGGSSYSRRPSKLVPQEKGMLSPSPFDISQPKTDYYSLLDQYPVLSKEFDSLAYFAKNNNFSLQEFERYLQQRVQYKQQHANIGTNASNLVDQLKEPERFAYGGTVPAMVSNGEAFVPPETAKKIGYGKLKRMNQADRTGMSGFALGGISVFKGPGSGTSDSIGPIGLPAGSFIIREKATKALGLNKGGIARFAFGGRQTDTNPSVVGKSVDEALGLVQISSATNASLRAMVETLKQLGVVGSNSAQILNNARNETAKSAQIALKADYELARASGASAETLQTLSSIMRESARQQETEIKIRQRIQTKTGSDDTGTTLQKILKDAEDNISKSVEKERTRLKSKGKSDIEIEEQIISKAGRRRQLYLERAARKEGIGLVGLNLRPQELENAINGLMRDSKVLSQMNAQYRKDRETELRNMGKNQREIKRIIDQEIKARESVTQQITEEQGVGGPARETDGSKGFLIATGLIAAGASLSSLIDSKTSAFNAALSSGISSMSQSFGVLTAVTSQLNPMLKSFADSLRNTGTSLGRLGGKIVDFGSKLIGAAGTVLAINSAIISSINSWRDFETEITNKTIESSLKVLETEFARVGEDIKKFNLNTIESILTSSANRLNRTLDDINARARLTFNTFYEWLETFTGFRTEESFGRLSDIQRLGGTEAKARAISGKTPEENKLLEDLEYQNIIPQLAREQAEQARQLAESITKTFELRLKKGESVASIVGDANFNELATTMANASSIIRQRILELENSSGLDQATINQQRRQIIETYAREQLSIQNSIIQREKETDKTSRFANVFTLSLKRSFDNLSQILNKTSFEFQKLSNDIDLLSSAYSGQAKILNTTLSTINILENPRAYSDGQVNTARSQAQSFLGGTQLGRIAPGLLASGDVAEDTIMSTINTVLRENAGATDELIGREITKNLKTSLADIGLPPELVSFLAKEIGKQIEKLRTQGKDQVSFAELQNSVAGLSQTMEFSKMANDAVIQSLKLYNTALNNYETNLNKIIDLEIARRNKLRKADEILLNATNSLANALNKTISLERVRANLQNTVRSLTDQQTPAEIFNKIVELTDRLAANQDIRNQAANRGPSGTDDFIKFTDEVKKGSIALRENYQALELLANNTDLAAAAMEKINSGQQKIEGRASFIEKLVTSGPDEIDNLNRAFYRLQNNINGQTNSIQNSVGAQNAYVEAINNGQNSIQAMRAAQTAFAQERGDTLNLFKELIPFLGDNQQSNQIRANVLENMLLESGIGINPMMMQVLNSLRNPENDPGVAEAISFYNEATTLQAEANKYLAKLDGELASDIANKNANAIAEALKSIELTFTNRELKDIAKNINTMVNFPPAQARADGGIIYASDGQMVNFAPQGTDTVPAMLTPGEFVVNRNATQKHRGLLENINSNKYSSGGKVRYYAQGGYVSDLGDKEQFLYSDTVTIDPLISSDSITSQDISNSTKIPLYRTPSVYTVINPAGNALQSPDINSENRDLTGLKPNRGQVVSGYGPTISDDGNYRYESELDVSDALNNNNAYKNSDTFLYLNKDPIPARKLKYTELEDYRKHFLSSGNDMWSKDPFELQENLFTDVFPRVDEVGTYEKNRIENHRDIGRSRGLTTNPNLNRFSEQSPQYKIYRSLGGGIIGNKPSAVSADTPDFIQGEYAGLEFQPATPLGHYAWYEEEGDQNFSGFEIIKKSIENRDRNYARYLNTSRLLSAPDPSSLNDFWELNNVDQQADATRRKLADLYEGKKNILTIEPIEINRFFPKIKEIENLKDQNSNILFGSDILKNIANKAIEYYQPNPGLVVQDKPYVSVPGLMNIPPDLAEWVKTDGFSIYGIDATGGLDLTKPEKKFGFIANYDLDLLDDETRKQVVEDLKGKHPGQITMRDLPLETLDITLPNRFGIPKFSVPVAYQEWSGKLYDPINEEFIGNPIKAILPNSVNNNTLFSGLDIRNRRLVNDRGTRDRFTAPQILGALQNSLAAINQNDIDDYIEYLLGDQNKQFAKENIKNSLVGTFSDYYLKNIDGSSDEEDEWRRLPFDILTTVAPRDNISLNMGQAIVDAIDKNKNDLAAASGSIGDKAKRFKGLSIGEASLPQTVSNAVLASIQTIGRQNIPGLPFGWLGSQIGAVPTILKNRPDIALAANLANASASVLSGLSGHIQMVGNMARNPGQYQYLKEVFTASAGASSILSGLASGNTNFVAQALATGADWLSIFRSAGNKFLVDKLLSEKIPQDLENQLANDLVGGKIKTVGPGGRLGDGPDMVDAIPTDWKGLVNLAFNPYNEFPTINTRGNLIKKISQGLSGAIGPFGLPYFDPNTMAFINTNLSSLFTWYQAQDSLFDKALQPNNAQRINQFRASIAATDKGKANRAHTILGFATQYGPLPDEDYFDARIAQGFQTGGVVYAENGGQMVNFQPRGTDTVPAMLTPGEFVVNRAATQENLPLLKAINDGASVSSSYSQGGVIYAAGGTRVGNRGVGQRSNKVYDPKTGTYMTEEELEREKNTSSSVSPSKPVVTAEEIAQGIRARNEEIFKLAGVPQQETKQEANEKTYDMAYQIKFKDNFEIDNRLKSQLGLPYIEGRGSNARYFTHQGRNVSRAEFDMLYNDPTSKFYNIDKDENYQKKIANNWLNLNRDKIQKIDRFSDKFVTDFNNKKPDDFALTLNTIQGSLDALGFVPAFGAAADLANAGISLMRGDLTGAGINAIAAIPLQGDAIKAMAMMGQAGIYAAEEAYNENVLLAGATAVPTVVPGGEPPTPKKWGSLKKAIMGGAIFLSTMAALAAAWVLGEREYQKMQARRTSPRVFPRTEDGPNGPVSDEELKRISEQGDQDNLPTTPDGFPLATPLTPEQQAELERLNKRFREEDVQSRQRGGLIYASTGMMVPYEPRGTDTVPAMLTPGEFVVNRAATQKNLSLLKSINSGTSYMNQGGVVYAQEGSRRPVRESRDSGIADIGRPKLIEEVYRAGKDNIGFIKRVDKAQDEYNFQNTSGKTVKAIISGFTETNKKAMRNNIPYTDYRYGRLGLSNKDGTILGKVDLDQLSDESLQHVYKVFTNIKSSKEKQVGDAYSSDSEESKDRYDINSNFREVSSKTRNLALRFVRERDELENALWKDKLTKILSENPDIALNDVSRNKMIDFSGYSGDTITRDKKGGYLKEDFDKFMNYQIGNAPGSTQERRIFTDKEREDIDKLWRHIYVKSSEYETGYELARIKADEQAALESQQRETQRVEEQKRQNLIYEVYSAGNRWTDAQMIAKSKTLQAMDFDSTADSTAGSTAIGHIVGLGDAPSNPPPPKYGQALLSIRKLIGENQGFGGVTPVKLEKLSNKTLQKVLEYYQSPTLEQEQKDKDSKLNEEARQIFDQKANEYLNAYLLDRYYRNKIAEQISKKRGAYSRLYNKNSDFDYLNIPTIDKQLIDFDKGNLDAISRNSGTPLDIKSMSGDVLEGVLVKTVSGEPASIPPRDRLYYRTDEDYTTPPTSGLPTDYNKQSSERMRKMREEKSHYLFNYLDPITASFVSNQEIQRRKLEKDISEQESLMDFGGFGPLTKDFGGLKDEINPKGVKFEPYKPDPTLPDAMQQFYVPSKGYPVSLSFKPQLMESVREQMEHYEGFALQTAINDILLSTVGKGASVATYEDGSVIRWLGAEDPAGPLLPFVAGGIGSIPKVATSFRNLGTKIAPIASRTVKAGSDLAARATKALRVTASDRWNRFHKWYAAKARQRAATEEARKATEEARRAAEEARRRAPEEPGRRAAEEPGRKPEKGGPRETTAAENQAKIRAANQKLAEYYSKKGRDPARGFDDLVKKDKNEVGSRYLGREKGTEKVTQLDYEVIMDRLYSKLGTSWTEVDAAFKASKQPSALEKLKEIIGSFNRRAALKLHPDKGGDPLAFKAARNAAEDILKYFEKYGNKTTSYYKRGGAVYANQGTLVPYQPKGTDTVPAMLTPGEFVVNRQATQKNLPLLKSINSGGYMNNGGMAGAQNLYTQNISVDRSRYIADTLKTLKDSSEQNRRNYFSLNTTINELLSNQKDTKEKIDFQGKYFDSSLKQQDQKLSYIGNKVTQDSAQSNTYDTNYKALGGLIYAQEGTLVNYEPRGTDTVPAMLTPGEFVVNREATQQNLPLLRAINEGAKPYNKGGVVYFRGGGKVYADASMEEFNTYARQRTDIRKLDAKNLRNQYAIVDNEVDSVIVTDGSSYLWEMPINDVLASDLTKIRTIQADSSPRALAKAKQEAIATTFFEAQDFEPPDGEYKDLRAIPLSTLIARAESGFNRQPREDRIADELRYQLSTTPELFGKDAFTTNPADFTKAQKAKDLLGLIKWDGTPEDISNIVDLEEIVYKDIFPRKIYLDSILSNIRGGIKILRRGQALPIPLDNYPGHSLRVRGLNGLTPPLNILAEQQAYAEDELQLINELYEELGVNINFRPQKYAPTALNTFSGTQKPEIPPKVMEKGGIVYLEDGSNMPIRPYLQDPGSFGSQGVSFREGVHDRNYVVRDRNYAKTLRQLGIPHMSRTGGSTQYYDQRGREIRDSEYRNLSASLFYHPDYANMRGRAALGGGLAKSIYPNATGFAGGAFGTLGGPFAPFTIPAGYALGSLLGYFAQETALDLVAPEANSRVNQVMEENPVHAIAGSLMADIPLGGIGDSILSRIPRAGKIGDSLVGPFGGLTPQQTKHLNKSLNKPISESITPFVGMKGFGGRYVSESSNISVDELASLMRGNFAESIHYSGADPRIFDSLTTRMEEPIPGALGDYINNLSRISPDISPESMVRVMAHEAGHHIQTVLDPSGDLLKTWMLSHKDEVTDYVLRRTTTQYAETTTPRNQMSYGINDILYGDYYKQDRIQSMRKALKEEKFLATIDQALGNQGLAVDAKMIDSMLEQEAFNYYRGRDLGKFGEARLGLLPEQPDPNVIDLDLVNTGVREPTDLTIHDMVLGSIDRDAQRAGYKGIPAMQSAESGGRQEFLTSLFQDLGAGDPEAIKLSKSLVEFLQTKGYSTPPPPPPPLHRQNGGIVYASNGMMVNYQPKGTDTVPAMLTPGEFVVNRRATERNLPLLQSINNGGSIPYLSGGGAISYLADGTPGTNVLMDSVASIATVFNNAAEDISVTLGRLTAIFTKTIENMANLTPRTDNGVSNNVNPVDMIQSLGQKLDNFILQLQAALPDTIKVEGNHRVDVVINGAQALQALLAGPLQGLINTAVQDAFDAKNREREGS